MVITIIVLLILAAVSIATLTGENGILTQAGRASDETEIAEAKEKARLDIASWKADKVSNGEDSTLNDSVIKQIERLRERWATWRNKFYNSKR